MNYTARVNQIKAQNWKKLSDYDKEKIEERLATVAVGVAVIYVRCSFEVQK